MTPLPVDLALITAKTLEHYSERAAEFWEGTCSHDVKQNIEALLRHIRGAIGAQAPSNKEANNNPQAVRKDILCTL